MCPQKLKQDSERVKVLVMNLMSLLSSNIRITIFRSVKRKKTETGVFLLR